VDSGAKIGAESVTILGVEGHREVVVVERGGG
jgi:hypothetical protein